MAATEEWVGYVDFLAILGSQTRDRLLRGSRREVLPAGTLVEYLGASPTADVIERGVVRTFQTSPDGRQASIGYLHAGELLGGLAVLNALPVMTAQMVTGATLVRLDVENLRCLFEEDLEAARALAYHFATKLARAFRVVTVRSLGTMRDRLAFDLLERACAAQLQSGDLAFTITHEQLADSIGSAREVVSRVLGQMRRAGIVATSPGRVVVLDAERLSAISQGIVLRRVVT